MDLSIHIQSDNSLSREKVTGNLSSNVWFCDLVVTFLWHTSSEMVEPLHPLLSTLEDQITAYGSLFIEVSRICVEQISPSFKFNHIPDNLNYIPYKFNHISYTFNHIP